MAKDSFILYLEQQDIFEMLENEEAGQLIKAIFKYENTGQIPQLDKSLKIAFIPIKSALDRNKEKYEKVVKRNKRNIEKRWKENTKNTTGKIGKKENTKNTDNDNDNDNEHDNDKKEQEEKIHFAEFVSMTNAEYEKLVSTHGKEFANQCITVLDNYKGSNGKTYKSDYRAILNWVVDKVKEQQAKNKKETGFDLRKWATQND